MTPSHILCYLLGFVSPIAIVILLSLRCDYLYHRRSGHTKTKSLGLTIRRAFW